MIYYQRNTGIGICMKESFGVNQIRENDILVYNSGYSYLSNGIYWNSVSKIKSNKLNLKLYKDRIVDHDNKYIFYK